MRCAGSDLSLCWARAWPATASCRCWVVRPEPPEAGRINRCLSPIPAVLRSGWSTPWQSALAWDGGSGYFPGNGVVPTGQVTRNAGREQKIPPAGLCGCCLLSKCLILINVTLCLEPHSFTGQTAAEGPTAAGIIRKELKNISKIYGFMENRSFGTKWVLYTVLRCLVEKDSYGFVFRET